MQHRLSNVCTMGQRMKLCHNALNNPEVEIFCHDGYPGGKNAPYMDGKGDPYLCSAWNEEAKVCNLVLQPTVIVNVQESSRHQCECEKVY